MRSVITAWETRSPVGHSAEAHAAGLGTGAPAGDGPRVVPGFEVRQVLGPRGTRSMCRATGLAVATTGQLLAGAGLGTDRRAGYADEQLGLVLATSDNVQTLFEFNRDTWTRSRPYDVEPAQVPVLLMNVHASQCAIWHRLKGPNSTVCGGHLGSLLALGYATRMQRRGHAPAVLCGGVEEYSAARAAVAAADPGAGPYRPLGEGCAVFLLEDGDALAGTRPVLGEVLAVEFGFAPYPGGVQPVLAGCLRAALAKAGVPAARVAAVAPSPVPGAPGVAERSAITEVFGDVRLATASLDALGDTHAVSAAFQVVELLADRALAGRTAVVTGADTEGRVGCAVLAIA
ncbi:MAG TPA: beta-ketoacyl synthase N-terminal-like domain-containing protein [Rugosimonospora sp.]|nr:beta-ketoacyl synthase N-terminal-like domain-containing protein [Rugosimonospora sp.]